MEKDIIITEAPPYDHDRDGIYESLGFESEKQAKYLAVDNEDEINKFFQKERPNFSRAAEFVENRIMGDWKQRRLFVGAYLELMKRIQEARKGGIDI